MTFEQARSQIGKGGDKLIPVFLSDAEQQDYGEALENGAPITSGRTICRWFGRSHACLT
ncbi:hypothetical protein [Caballeronia sp. GAFFF1]|uniref:hypothetical protein n=1 Tax=Caballeronia sp. GAFFF1 TaxID=2921779 RepID=UPI002028C380|nr:hypothetical protein [Caballeronia sp. GAFFF1]